MTDATTTAVTTTADTSTAAAATTTAATTTTTTAAPATTTTAAKADTATTTTTAATDATKTDPAKTDATKTDPAKTDFKVPDAYKDKPWANKVKSMEDVYKALDGAQELIGKKTLPPIDYTKATPEEIKAYHETTRPADKAEYKFGDGANPDFVGGIADIFYDAGIPAAQGNQVIQAYEKFETAKLAEMTSEKGFKETMASSFGDKYDGVVASCVAEHKAVLNADDQKLMDKLPNQYLGLVYRLTEGMKKQYASKESGAQAKGDTGGTVPAGKSFEESTAALRTEIRTLSDAPLPNHDLIASKRKELDTLYQNKVGKK